MSAHYVWIVLRHPPPVPATRSVSDRERGRVHVWLAKVRGLYAVPEALNALAQCRSRATLELAATVLAIPGWRCVDDFYFENYRYRLEFNADCGGHVVDFLFSSRWN